MPLHLQDLEDVRDEMLEEVERDVANGTLYISDRLTDVGRSQYPDLLRQAVGEHDDDWLAGQIRSQDLLRPQETRNMERGPVQAKVPVTAPETLAEGEFNRFCIRGVCCSSLAAGYTEVEVYRAKEVARPRPESQAKIGTTVSAQNLLDDLRERPGVETALGIPGGPNSGLSVRRLPAPDATQQ